MIILVDNKNYAIRTCEDSDTYHFLDTTDGTVYGEMRLLSDLGYIIMVCGEEAEEYLDSHNIYYIHVETVAKESFDRFTKRMLKMIDERKDFVERNTTSETLVFGITKDGSKATMYTDNVFTITRLVEEDTLLVRYDIPSYYTKREKIEALKDFEQQAREHFGPVFYGVEEDDFYQDINFSSGKSIKEVLAKLHMFIAIMEASR